MNYIELQRMRKAAGLGWGWVNNLVGDDNIVSDVFGNNRQQRLDNYANQFRQQMNEDLGPATLQRQQQGAADWDRRVAAAGNHLDYRLTAAQRTAQPTAAPAQTAVAQQPQRNYQTFNRNNLSGYTQDQINAINAAAQKKGLKMGDITQVSFNDKGAVNGFRVRKGALNQQPQQPVGTKPNTMIAST